MGKLKTRPHEIHLRLNEEEYQALETNRKKCHLPQQTYLRKLCKGVKPEEFPPAEYMQMLHEIQVIGHELRMNAFRADSNGVPDRERYWEAVDRFQKQFSIFLHQFIKID